MAAATPPPPTPLRLAPLPLFLLLLALCPPASSAPAPKASQPAPGPRSAPGAAFHAARAALLAEKLGEGDRPHNAAEAADATDETGPPPPPPPRYLSAVVGERDCLPDDAHPPAAAIRHPSFNASAPGDPAAAAHRSLFVRRAPAGNGSGGLHLGDGPVPWVAVGLSWPDAVLAALEEEEGDGEAQEEEEESGGEGPARRAAAADGPSSSSSSSSSLSRRALMSRLLARLAERGFNALRVLALPRGAQPWPGALSVRHMDALDWLVSECRAHGLRLLLVLADGSPPPPLLLGTQGRGRRRRAAAIPASHAREYAAWVGEGRGGGESSGGDGTAAAAAATTTTATTKTEALGLRDGFFANDTVKSVFLDAAAAVVGRRNARVDGLAYRHDPTVIGWELLAGAHPGCFCGGGSGGDSKNSTNKKDADDHQKDPAALLRAWARQVAGFLRKKDPHHLVALGGDGLLGASSPHLAAAHNPPRLSGEEGQEAALCGRACAAGGGAAGSGGGDGDGDGGRVSLAHDWHDLTSSVPDLDLAVAAVAPWRFGDGGLVGKGRASLAPSTCRRGAWGRGPEAEDDGSGGACLSDAKRGGGGEAAWVRGWVRAHQRDSLRLQRPLLLTVEVPGEEQRGAGVEGGEATDGALSVLEAVAADVVRAVDERRAPSAGLFVSVVGRGGWRDGSGRGGGAAALLREVDKEAASLMLLSQAGLDAGPANTLERRWGADGGWRRFYHGQEEEEEEKGAGGGEDDGSGGGDNDGDSGMGPDALAASAREVLRVVGRLGEWQRKREAAAAAIVRSS